MPRNLYRIAIAHRRRTEHDAARPTSSSILVAVGITVGIGIGGGGVDDDAVRIAREEGEGKPREMIPPPILLGKILIYDWLLVHSGAATHLSIVIHQRQVVTLMPGPACSWIGLMGCELFFDILVYNLYTCTCALCAPHVVNRCALGRERGFSHRSILGLAADLWLLPPCIFPI